jgi:hypothetical protein
VRSSTTRLHVILAGLEWLRASGIRMFVNYRALITDSP